MTNGGFENLRDDPRISYLLGALEMLADAGKAAHEKLSELADGVATAEQAISRPYFAAERLEKHFTSSIRGIGNEFYRGGLDDAGRRFLRNFTGRLAEEVSGAISGELGGGFFAEVFGGILGELVRGIGGLFGAKKKRFLKPVELENIFNPPAMLMQSPSLLPSSSALGGRSVSSLNVNVTVNGVVGAPADVADEIERIVTRRLGALNRREA